MRKIQSFLVLGVAVVALSGCQGLGAPGGAVQQQPISVAYAGGGALEVTTTDRVAISQVEVVGPSGPIPATTSVHRETVDPYAQQAASPPIVAPFFGVGVGAGRWHHSHATGSGVFIGVPPFGYGSRYGSPLGYGQSTAAPPDSGVVRSTARITFDNPADYERAWQSARVRVRLGDPQVGPVTELPAPAPR